MLYEIIVKIQRRTPIIAVLVCDAMDEKEAESKALDSYPPSNVVKILGVRRVLQAVYCVSEKFEK